MGSECTIFHYLECLEKRTMLNQVVPELKWNSFVYPALQSVLSAVVQMG